MPQEVLLYRTPMYINGDAADLQFDQVARALDDGHWVSGWTDMVDPGENGDAYVRVFNPDASPLTTEVRVNQTVEGDQRLKDIVTLADGAFVVIWSSFGSGITADQHGLYMRHFLSDGTPLGDERLILNEPDLTYISIKGTALADGGFVLVSDDLGASPFSINRMTFDADLAQVGDVEVLSNLGSGFVDGIAIETMPGGGYIVSWMDLQSNVYAQRLNDAGETVGEKFTVATDALSYDLSGRPMATDVAALVNGGWVVTWIGRSGTTDRDAFLRVYDADGTAGDVIVVGESAPRAQTHSTVTHLLDGGFLVALIDQRDPEEGETGSHFDRIGMQRYSADGSEYGSPFVFEDLDQINEAQPRLETLSDGRVVVTWTLGTEESLWEGTVETSSVAQQVVALPREGTEGDDVMTPMTGANFLLGLGGNDRIIGGDNADYLLGEVGNDTLEGGGGDDTLIGGEGLDVVDFFDAAFAIVLNLEDGSAEGEGTDQLIAIEHALGSAHDDSLVGDALANAMIGNEGADRIEGAGGDDMLFGDDISPEDLAMLGLTSSDIFLLA